MLYAMYLDKPMRDHTLLQAIARVNRPYERPEEGSGGAGGGAGAAGPRAAGTDDTDVVVKPHGFVLDFVGIFDKLEKALAFDSDEVNAIVKDLALLKGLFRSKMETAPDYLALVTENFNDKDVDRLIEHFLDKERRKEFFRHYKEIEMLYEIISPDAFLSPFLAGYAMLSAIYAVVRRAYAKQVYVDRAVKLGVDARSITVRSLTTKWASCSTTGRLTFDAQVPELSLSLQDYVIVHELLHFSTPNHGRLWKSLMRAHLGDYETQERELREIASRASRPIVDAPADAARRRQWVACMLPIW